MATPPSPTGYLATAQVLAPFRVTASSETSSDSSDLSQTSSDFERELQRNWDESLRTLSAILNVVLIPYGSRIYGKKFSEFVYARYLVLGGMDTTRFWVGRTAASWLLSRGIGFARDFA